MISDKDIREAEQNLKRYFEDDLLKKNPAHAQFVKFYVNNAKMSLQLSSFLLKLSTDAETKKSAGFPEDFECLLWVIVTSYYSMFYVANAAMAKLGLKVGEKIAHKITQDVLLVYFIKNNRLAKSLLEDYKTTKSEVLGLMNVGEEELMKEFQVKAKELVATFGHQRERRGEFQYDITKTAKEHVARLSLERAKNFIQEMTKVIEKP
ncbi:hypothetical protein HY493_03845 [Candidatus Woesearchaeota archaeon]|nr:hypothetical protein [Candidatus Woesearchaeota archaeon]